MPGVACGPAICTMRGAMKINDKKILTRGARTALLCAALAGLGAGAGTPASAASHAKTMDHSKMDHGQAKVHATGAWARPTIGNSRNGAAYFSVSNTGTTDDVLVGVRGEVAGALELHTHIREGDTMRMRRVKDGIKIPAGATVVLAPGGDHVMMIGLTGKLEAGAGFPLTLVFRQAGEIPVEVKVQMKGPAGGGGHKH